MFVRLYVTAKNKTDAKKNLKICLEKINPILVKANVEKLEPYWKFDDMYVVELNLIVKKDLSLNELTQLLETISDKWQYYGDPINEFLASKTAEGCNYILKGVEMINIYLDE
ncbi:MULTISPECIES: hypothetical protein [Priestia]|uniref:hypothetical protein n=1 Tax=Priestia TaxID=2800373 RepID=UPI00064F1210|nr:MULTISPECIES: hypothetical protein [Priestia]KML31413.1 hypothetical protein VL11_02335 [Priestia aryabhattai]KMN93143.1 hypothetical protein ABV89_26275 [Priestia aryabhattai]QDZ81103.1 hypothetical protein D0440_17180 [Priestia megaterium]